MKPSFKTMRRTVLAAALLAAYAYAPGAAAVNLTIGSDYDLGDSTMTNSTVTVVDGGVATGDGASIEGSAYDVVLINSGGSLTLKNAFLSNDLDTPTGTNGRTIKASGADATASLTDSAIEISAQSTNPGADYAHAFTAAVGAEDGGHVDVNGGTISAAGSKRTVGIQANNGGSIDASDVTITTNSSFGHAVNAYTDPAGDGPATVVTLDNVTIKTNDTDYADGIQSANKGASVVATDTNITTVGTNSFGAEVFNGATVSLKDGSITTSGANAAGVRAYAGDGNTLPGEATVNGTTITTSGKGAIGVVAGDLDGSSGTAGNATLSGAHIATSGQGATGIQANYGGKIDSTGSVITTSGKGAHAAAALNGSSITLNGDTLTAQGTGYGLYVDGAGSNVAATNGTAIETNNGKYAVEAADGGQVGLSGGSVTNAGTTSDRTAIYATGDGTLVTAQNVDISNKAPGLGTGDLSNVVSAANKAKVELNGGTVTSEGATFGRGLLASSGATIDASGVDISTAGTLSNAVHAFSADEGPSGHHNDPDSAFIALDGGTVSTTGDNSYGLSSQNEGAVITATDTTGNTSITTTGANSFGASAYNGGALDLTGVKVSTTGSGADGIAVNALLGAQKPKYVPTPGIGSTLHLKDSTINTTGDSADGLYVGYGSTATLEDTDIAVTGVDASGVYITGGSTATLDGGSVSSIGTDWGTGLYANGVGSTLVANGVDVTVQRTRDSSPNKPLGVGYESKGGGSITLTDGSVTTKGDWNDGLLAFRGTIATDGTAIQTNGLASTGVKAWREANTSTHPGDTSTATLTGGSVATLGNESYGLLAQNAGSSVAASNLAVSTAGNDSYGVDAYNGGAVVLDNVSISTTGEDAHGLVMGGMSDTMRPGSDGKIPGTASAITMTGGSVQAMGQGSSGLYLEDSGSITLNNTRVESNAASITSQLTQSGQEQSITIGSGSNLTVNNGVLLQVDRTADGMDGIVTLNLEDGSTSHGDIVDLDGLNEDPSLDSRDPTGNDMSLPHGKTIFNVGANATWSGVVRGISDSVVEDGSTVSFTDSSVTGNVTTGSSTSTTFTGTTDIGGGVSTGSGSATTFNGTTTIGNSSDPSTGNVNGTDSTLNFNGDTTITNTVSGTGSTLNFNGNTNIGNGVSGGNGTHFVFSSTATTNITGDINLDGGSTTHGGTVDNIIQVSGGANVSNGATLGGDINFGGPVVLDNGIIGPGNSVGIQTMPSLSGTGAYHADVNSAGKSDLIHVTGTVDLSGIDLQVGQENGNGGYLLNHDYTILKADSGLGGTTFKSAGLDSSLSGSLVKLDPVMYDSALTNATVMVSLSLDSGKVNAFHGTPNQESTLDGAISVMGGNSAADAALSSSDPANALDQLSGESLASTPSVLLASGGLMQSALFDRLNSNLGAGSLPGAPVAQASGPLPASAMPQSAALPMWVQTVGNWSTLGGTSNTAPVSTSTGGVFLGGDVPVGAGWRVGGAFGYTNSNIDVDDRSSSADVDSYTAAVYGGKSVQMGSGRLKFMAGVGITRNNVDSRRSVTLGGSQTLKASYHADAAQVFTEMGYAMPFGAGMEIEPYAGLSFQSLHTQGFDESGGDAALSVSGQTDNVTTSTLGLRGKRWFDLGARQAVLSAGLGWRHAMGDITPTSRMAFTTGGGTSFSVEGAPVVEDAAVVSLGGEMAVNRNAALGLRYNGQFGSGSHDNSGVLYLKVSFQ
jgi:outer membrane autotransporter protein